MKIPEPFFKLINLVVRLLLSSPVHGLVSDSLLVIEFAGRKSGRRYKTPVRYVDSGELIQCFTSKSGQWWRNVAAADQVTVLIAGVQSVCRPVVVTDDPVRIGAALKNCLSLYPQDSAYHDISIDPDGSPNDKDFEQALPNVVLIELTRQSSGT